jgi:hypothetical protein
VNTVQTPVSETTDFPPSASNWLSYITDMLGAEAGGMLVVRPDGSHSVLAIGHDESAISQYQDHFSRLDPLTRLLEERPHGRALVIDTTRHPAYLERPELRNDYLRPHGIDHVIATQWRHPDGTLHMVGVQRFTGSEPFSVAQGAELDRYVHHWRVEAAVPPQEGLDARSADARRSCDIAAQITVPWPSWTAALSSHGPTGRRDEVRARRGSRYWKSAAVGRFSPAYCDTCRNSLVPACASTLRQRRSLPPVTTPGLPVPHRLPESPSLPCCA